MSGKCKIDRLNISKMKIQMMIIDGWTKEEIAKFFGCSVDTIKRRLKNG